MRDAIKAVEIDDSKPSVDGPDRRTARGKKGDSLGHRTSWVSNSWLPIQTQQACWFIDRNGFAETMRISRDRSGCGEGVQHSSRTWVDNCATCRIGLGRSCVYVWRYHLVRKVLRQDRADLPESVRHLVSVPPRRWELHPKPDFCKLF
jgi:hypothetical protein